MARDPRNEDDNEDSVEDGPIDVASAIRAAKTAALLGRAPTPAATAKIGAFELEQAIAKSREGETSTTPPPSDRPTVDGDPPPPIVTMPNATPNDPAPVADPAPTPAAEAAPAPAIIDPPAPPPEPVPAAEPPAITKPTSLPVGAPDKPPGSSRTATIIFWGMFIVMLAFGIWLLRH